MDATTKFQRKIVEWREHPSKMVRELFDVDPDPWQEEALETYGKVPRLAFIANKGPGKAGSKAEYIWTPDGERRFGELVKGSTVFAEDGSITRVTAVYDRGILPVYRVTFDDGASLLACGEHLWKVQGRTERQKNLGWSVIDTDTIRRRGVTVPNGRWAQKQFLIPKQGAAQFPEASLPLDPYVAGVWIGDGTKSQPCYHKPDAEVEAEIRRRGYSTTRGTGDRVRVMASVAAFEALECYGENSPGRFVPDAYKRASVEQRRDLLCGLMDTDGCIGDDSHMEYDTTSERLAHDVVWLVRSLGGVALVKPGVKKAYYRGEDGERVACKDCWRVTVRLPFNPFRVPRKAERWVDPMRSPSTERYLTRFIASIEPAGEADCMCIEVDHPSHCYLANDFIVTHNTAAEAWISWNFLLTRPHPKIGATSISGDNLDDGLWSEMAKWREKAPILKAMFEWTKTKIFNKEAPETWFMSRRTWPKTGSSEEQANTLAGLHADYIMFILDESGSIPVSVLTAAEQVLTGGPKEAHVIQAGNPTSTTGSLHRAHLARHLWYVINITGDPDNPKRSSRMTVEYAREQIKEWGRNNPYVLVNIFGEFPPTSLNALIGPDEVRAAMGRYYRDYELYGEAKVIGVDLARQGSDSTVFAFRHGRQMFPFEQHRGVTGNTGAPILNRRWAEFGADAVFLDGTGGFSTSWEDNLERLGRRAVPVHFNSSPHEKQQFDNKRAEMYWDLCAWIKSGGAVPQDEEFLREITETTYTFAENSDVLMLEPKKLIQSRIGRSPDKADAAALCFAEKVSPMQSAPLRRITRNVAEYDPYSEPVDSRRAAAYRGPSDYNPFG